MFLFLTCFYCLFSIFLPLLWAERQFTRPTNTCYKATQVQQQLEAAEGESMATGPLDNKLLPFCTIKNE